MFELVCAIMNQLHFINGIKVFKISLDASENYWLANPLPLKVSIALLGYKHK